MRQLLPVALLWAVACDPAPLSPVTGAPSALDDPLSGSRSARATDDVVMTGVLVPEGEVVLVASGFARIDRLDAEVGDHVAEGSVVAELEVRGDRTDLAIATQAWKASTAEIDRLALELEKARESRADVEELESYVAEAEIREKRYAEKLAAARRRSAGASAQQQRSRMKEAATRIADGELRAPFTGVIARRYVNSGATLTTGEPVVKIISDARIVRFAVPEEHNAALQLGAPVSVRFVDAGVEVMGEVTSIAPEIEVGTRLIFAEASLSLTSEQRALLRVGAVSRVRFAHAQAAAPTAPTRAPEIAATAEGQ